MPREDTQQPFSEEERGKVLDPHPDRRRHLTELFYKFATHKVSVADLMGISKKRLQGLAEAGYLKYKYGRYQEALNIFEPLASLESRNFYYHTALGGIYQKMGRSVDSVVEYSRALRLNPRDVCSYVNRGEIYLRHKNFKKAAEDFRKAILLDATGKNLWSNRARSLVIALRRNLELKRKTAKPAVRPVVRSGGRPPRPVASRATTVH